MKMYHAKESSLYPPYIFFQTVMWSFLCLHLTAPLWDRDFLVVLYTAWTFYARRFSSCDISKCPRCQELSEREYTELFSLLPPTRPRNNNYRDITIVICIYILSSDVGNKLNQVQFGFVSNIACSYTEEVLDVNESLAVHQGQTSWIDSLAIQQKFIWSFIYQSVTWESFLNNNYNFHEIKIGTFLHNGPCLELQQITTQLYSLGQNDVLIA